jgi:sugar-phosphatase
LGYPIGLASNSPDVLIEAALRKLAISEHFSALCSSVHEPQGKPHPGVYFTVAARLGVAPSRCLVFEDSVPGVRAAKAAGMATVAVPPPELFADPAFAVADLKLASLRDFTAEHAAALGAH